MHGRVGSVVSGGGARECFGQAGTVVVEDDGGENGATHMCSAVGQVYMGVLGV